MIRLIKCLLLFLLGNAGYVAAQQNDLYLLDAQLLLQEGDTLNAIKNLKSILDNDPSNFPAALRLAEVYYEQGAWYPAAAYATVGLNQLAEVEQEKVHINYAQAQYDTASGMLVYEEYQSLKKSMASLLHLRGKTKFRQENYESAFSDLRAAFDYAPESSDIQVDLGLVAMHTKDTSRALYHLYSALDIDSANYKAWYNLANLSLARQDTAKALEMLVKSVNATEDFDTGRMTLASLYMDLRDYPNAIDAYSKILEDDSGSIEARFRRAYAYKQLDQDKNAIEDWEKIFDFNNGQMEAIRNAGLTRMENEDYEGAITNFSHYIKNLPDAPLGYLNRGYAYMLCNNFEEAIADLKK